MRDKYSSVSLLAMLGAVPLALGISASGCAGTRAAPEVEESWIARVPEENLSGVYKARANLQQAEDDVERAEVARRDAERALSVARHEHEAAEARVDAAQEAVKAARAKGQPEGIEVAQSELRQAERALAAAQTQVEWREKQVEAKEAEKEWRERVAEVNKAQVSLEEYRALEKSGDVRANRLSEAEFREALTKAQVEAAEKRRDFETRARQAQRAHDRFTEEQDALKGYGGSGRSPKQGG